MTTGKKSKKTKKAAPKKQAKKRAKKYVVPAQADEHKISIVEEPQVAYGSISSSISIFVSDTEQVNALKKAAASSSRKAIRESKALGLTITYMKEGILYEETADGIVRVIKNTRQKPVNTIAGIRLKKGMVLHVKK